MPAQPDAFPNGLLDLDADELEREVRKHNRLYWDNAAPEISDELYDMLVERLRRLRPQSPVLLDLGPDATAGETAGKVRHNTPMLSLEKCYTEAELLRFFERFSGRAVASHKVDGLAISLRYGPDGRLDLAATRGTGTVGDAITEQVRRVVGVPSALLLGSDTGAIEVRGEAYMPISTFRERYAEAFANPRNLAAGALKQKDAAHTANYGIHFLAYDALGASVRSEAEKRALLERLGFTCVPFEPCDAGNAQATFERLRDERMTLDFETDGVVFKVDDTRQHDELGVTAHHPRYAIAYKYQGESGFSTFRDVEWSVSRTGAINPVALIAPVSLSGVTVTRVSLHNLGIMERIADRPLQRGENHDYPLSAGARVLVTRRGGVIPHIESLAEPGGSSLFVPTACPSCGQPTVRRDDFLFAEHAPGCTVQARRQLEHFTATTDMLGLGSRLIEQLLDTGLVQTPADLYRLKADDVEGLDRMGRKSAEKVIQAIQSKRTIALPTFVAALGIAELGGRVATQICGTFPSLQQLRGADIESLQGVDGIGPVMASKIVTGLAEQAPTIDALLDAGVVIAAAEPPAGPVDGPLGGQSFVFTGTLDSMGRKDAQDLVRSQGGLTPDDVTQTTDFLVLGDADHARFEAGWRSSKLKKAEKLAGAHGRPRIIAEREFLAMIGR